MRFDQQHLNVLGLLPSEEASREVSLGRLVDDLDDSQRLSAAKLCSSVYINLIDSAVHTTALSHPELGHWQVTPTSIPAP